MSIDGTYNIIANTPIGPQENKLVLKTKGNILTGTGTGMTGTDQIENGKINGNIAEFTINTSTPFGPIKLDFKLTFEGDKVTGIANTPFGPQHVEGKRA